MPLEDTLELDISSALQSIDTLASSMDQAATQFGVALAEAIDTLREPVPVEADVSSVAPDIEAAVASAETVVVPEADASAITPAIDEAVAAADVLVLPEADASAVTDEVTAAVSAADATVAVVVEADVGDIQAEIEAAVSGASTDVTIGANTEQAEESLADLGLAATQAEGGIGGADAAMGSLGIAATLASGNVGGLKTGFTQLVPGSSAVGGAVAGIGAVAGAASVFFDAALDAQTSADTFRIAVGDMGEEVSNIDIGGLNMDLGELATTLGQDDEAAFDAAARIFQLGEASGEARPKVAETTKQIAALAAQAISLNPALGDLGTVAEGMVGALARGGRPAAQLGIELSGAEIEARALRDTGKSVAAELTIFEKAAAGAAIATERFGGSIGEDVRARAETTGTSFARLGQQLQNVVETAGQPLLDPLLASLTEAQPALEQTAAATGEMLAAVIPLAAELATSLAPLMIASAEATSQLATGIEAATGAIDGALGVLPDGINSIGALGGAVAGAINPITQITGIVGDAQEVWGDWFGSDDKPGTVGYGAHKVEESAEAFAEAGKKTGDWTQAQSDAAIAANTAADGTIDYKAALDTLESGMLGNIASTGDLITAEEALATEAERVAAALTLQKDAQDALLGVVVSAEQADIRYVRAQDDLRASTIKVWEAQVAHNEAVRVFGERSGEAGLTNEALRLANLDLRESSVGAFNAATTLTEAVFAQAEAMDAAGPEVAGLRDQLVGMRDEFPELRNQIDKYIDKIDGLKPPDLKMEEAVAAAGMTLAALASTLGPTTAAQAREVGRIFGRSLADGIDSEGERLRVAGALAGQRVTQASRQSFGMRSPSKVGIEIGKNFAEAVAAGIEYGGDTAAVAAAEMAEELADAVREGFFGMEDQADMLAMALASAVIRPLADVHAKIENALFADWVAGGAFEGRRIAISLPGVVETEEAETLFRVLRSGNPTIAEWVALLDGTGLSMEQLLGIQKDLNAEVATFASQMVSAFDTVEDALAGLKPDTSLLDFMEDANERVRATLELQRDLNTLRRRGADDLAAALASQGANAAQAVADALALDRGALQAQEREFERILAIDERNAERATNLATALVATLDSPEVTRAAMDASAKLGERTADALAFGIASHGGIVRETVQSLFEVAVAGALEEAIDRMAHLG